MSLGVMIARYYGNTVTLRKIVRQEKEGHGWTEIIGDTEVKGRMRPLLGDEQILADKNTERSTHVFYCDIGTDIERSDKIIFNEQEYEVRYVKNVMNMSQFLQVYLELRDHVS